MALHIYGGKWNLFLTSSNMLYINKLKLNTETIRKIYMRNIDDYIGQSLGRIVITEECLMTGPFAKLQGQ